MNIYSEKQYIDMINDYFKNFSDRALLLEGEWGSGKTYFIRNKFKESLNENDVLIYISLYGMNTTDNIDTYYLDSVLKEEYLKRFPMKVGADTSIKLFEVLKKSNAILEVLMDKNDFASIFQKNRNYYIVLDDLERCTIDLTVLLGFINHLTEQKNNNVLVIANENEIGKSNIKSDVAQKYITSLLAKNIEIEEPNLFIKDNKFSDIKTLNQLNLKSDAIFNNDINFIYKNFKEKTFGKTITFLSNIDIIYEENLKNFNESVVKSFLTENKKILLGEFKSSNISNLRILESCLKTFERFDFIFSYFYEYEKYPEFKNIFIKSVIKSEINHSKGIDKQIWGSKGEYTEISDSFEIFSTYTAFKFLEDYIWNSFVDDQNTLIILDSYINSLNKEFKDDPINKIKYFWQMEDNEVEKNIIEILNGLGNSIYPPSMFEEIFARLILLNEIGFQINFENVLELMSNTTNVELISNNEMSLYQIKYNEDPFVKYKNSFDRIIYIKEKLINNQYINVLVDIFNEEFWSYQLYRTYTKYEKHFYDCKQFLGFLDINKIIENLKSSSNSIFAEFISCINSIYKSNYFEHDKDYLLKIYEYLKEERFQSILKENNRKEALKILERILKMFK